MKKSLIMMMAVLLLPALLCAKGAIVGYAAGWAAAPSDAQLDMVTHVMVFQVHPLANGDLNRGSLANWLTKAWVTKAHSKNVKVSVAIGGWVGSGENKSPQAAYWVSATNSQNIDRFVNNLVALVNEFGLDGLDIDWEYPQGDSGWQQYMNLCRKLREKLPGKRLSSALPGSTPNGYYSNVVKNGIMNALDAIHLMAYDMEGSWGNHSALAPSKKLIDDWAQWTAGTEGYDKEKLFLGVPFYSKKNFAEWKDFGNETRFYQDQYTDEYGVVQTYNSSTTLRNKTEYCYDKGYGGIMIWELSQDFAPSHKLSLLKVLYNTTDSLGGYTEGKLRIAVNYNNAGGKLTVGGATISSGSSIELESGQSKTVTITANSGYEISEVIIDGASNSEAKNSGSYSFVNVTKNRSISVAFAKRIVVPSRFSSLDYSSKSSEVVAHSDENGNYVGDLRNNSYLEYFINVGEPGNYTISAKNAVGANGQYGAAKITFSIGGETLGVADGSVGEGWFDFVASDALPVTLTGGKMTLRLTVSAPVNIEEIIIAKAPPVAIAEGRQAHSATNSVKFTNGVLIFSFAQPASRLSLSLFNLLGKTLLETELPLHSGSATLMVPEQISRNQQLFLRARTDGGDDLTERLLLK